MKPPEANPKRGGEAKFAWDITTSHFDIHQGGSSNAMCHMCSNLIRWNLGDGLRTIITDLAKKWDVSADQKQYTFKLRSGVKFSDGTPFSAEDVVASLTRIVDPPTGIVSPNKVTQGTLGHPQCRGNRVLLPSLLLLVARHASAAIRANPGLPVEPLSYSYRLHILGQPHRPALEFSPETVNALPRSLAGNR